MTQYYVTTTGNNTNNGLTESTAWQTITYAATKAIAGDIVNIKAENYGHEHVVFMNSGTSTSPIVFQGYNGIPLIDGIDGYGYGFYIENKSYITLKNIKSTHYEHGFNIKGTYINMDNIETTENYYYGIYITSSNNINLINSNIIDGGGMCGVVFSTTHYSLIDNVVVKKTANLLPRNYISGMGYYLILGYSNNCIVRNCSAINTRPDMPYPYHPGHGIGIKDDPSGGVYQYPHSYNNTFYNLTIENIAEPFLFAHGAYNNKVYNFTIDSSSLVQPFYGLTFRDGSNNNTAYNGTVIGRGGEYCLLQFDESTEATGIQYTNNNTIKNIVFINSLYGIYIFKAHNNILENNIFIATTTGNSYLFGNWARNPIDESGNIFKNNIVMNFKYKVLSTTNINILYSNFWNNGFPIPTGIGNITTDPLFADIINNDYHLKSQYGRWNGTKWVNDDITSLCIQAGNPSSNNSLSPWGGIIEMGIYGNTIEASNHQETCSTPIVTIEITQL